MDTAASGVKTTEAPVSILGSDLRSCMFVKSVFDSVFTIFETASFVSADGCVCLRVL